MEFTPRIKDRKNEKKIKKIHARIDITENNNLKVFLVSSYPFWVMVQNLVTAGKSHRSKERGATNSTTQEVKLRKQHHP